MDVTAIMTHPAVILSLFFALPWLLYWDSLSGDWLIDDQEGMASYDGKLQTPLSFHNCLKWVRWQLGRIPNPNEKEREQRPYIGNPRRHHRLSLWMFGGVLCLLYSFLQAVFTPSLAFFATLLFAVHPVGCQVVAWISGIGYLFAAFFMLAGLNVAVIAEPSTALTWAGWLTLYGLLQYLAAHAQFTALGAVPLLFWLGLWPFALVGLAVSAYSAFGTVKSAVDLRVEHFTDQGMGRSTFFHARKMMVAGKTLYYYCKLAVFPKRMGLYHLFGYHYQVPEIELEDRYFYAGCGCLALFGLLFWLGAPPLQLAVITFLSFIVFVMNWITAHQFVAERYVWLPSIGVALALAHLTGGTPFYWLLVGIGTMRIWAHLPTFQNDMQFYFSNIWNFPKSEVAVGNLGVSLARYGMPNAAMDFWHRGTQLNPDYDVNWYNIGSALRTQAGQAMDQGNWTTALAFLQKSRDYFDKAVNTKTCHFKELWTTQLREVEAEIAWGSQVMAIPMQNRLAWQVTKLELLLDQRYLALREFWESKLKIAKEAYVRGAD